MLHNLVNEAQAVSLGSQAGAYWNAKHRLYLIVAFAQQTDQDGEQQEVRSNTEYKHERRAHSR